MIALTTISIRMPDKDIMLNLLADYEKETGRRSSFAGKSVV